MVYTPNARPFPMPERSVEECLRLWGTVTYRAATNQHRQFADRIAHQAARPDWVPGSAQLAFMRQLVDLYAYDDIAVDPELMFLIEANGGTA